ncbi:hypothetical protein PPL_12405 [Heterostelium album PN500]|uniref:Uncharacterized protein n=1 Tax=Heterostelium pallidum (strain ATCC 26659 / Pp 5 / PN500) TaxID=670386 RepID=D3BMI5_HETP5|nr:hypothetical protein PPL_12405 [Heterostelium album PN500]EFA77197.1 hypothetical protein PPL_12405 [Heterostelium album PN500]|eukprot:XP_020429326.1 hypothetical protein PPL_12405 [Heterostelium album PN500]
MYNILNNTVDRSYHNGNNHEYFSGDLNRILTLASAVVYTVITIVILIEKYKYPKSSINYVLIGSVSESIGYFVRFAAVYHTDSFVLYVVQQVLILIPPNLITFGWYNIVAKVVKEHYYNVNLSKGKVRLGLISSSIVQIIGSYMYSKADTRIAGRAIVIVGLFMTTIVYIICFICCCRVYSLLRQEYKMKMENLPTIWRLIFFGLFLAITLLTIRSIYRIIHYFKRFHHLTFYIFDTLLIIIILVAWSILYPTKEIHQNNEDNYMQIA